MLQKCSRARARSTRSSGLVRTWCYTARRCAPRVVCTSSNPGALDAHCDRARMRAGIAHERMHARGLASKLWTNRPDTQACARWRSSLRRFESGRKSRCVSSSACNRSAVVIRCCPIMQRTHDGRREAVRDRNSSDRNELAGSRSPHIAYAVEADASGETFFLAAFAALSPAARSVAVRSTTLLEVRT